MCRLSISVAFPSTPTQTCRIPSLLRFVPPWRQGRKKFLGKKKDLYPWTACVAIRRKARSIFPYTPPPSVSGANAVTYPDKRFSAGSDCFGEIVTAVTGLGLPTFDGGAETFVRGSAAPVEMMLFGRPLEQDHHRRRIVLAAQNQTASAAGRFATLNCF